MLLSDAGIEAALDAISTTRIPPGQSRRLLVRCIVKAYLEATPALRPGAATSVKSGTWQLAHMAIGDVIDLGDLTQTAARSRMVTARKLALNSEMRWSCWTEGSSLMCKRREDGVERHRPPPEANRKAVFLAALDPAGTRELAPISIFPMRTLDTSTKAAARRILGVREAEWRRRVVMSKGQPRLQIWRTK